VGVDEKLAIVQALEKTAGNKTMAARLLGISRRNIYRKIKNFKIETKNK
jgi:two-component system response regulator AtoC